LSNLLTDVKMTIYLTIKNIDKMLFNPDDSFKPMLANAEFGFHVNATDEYNPNQIRNNGVSTDE